jgi:hypothetical protein
MFPRQPDFLKQFQPIKLMKTALLAFTLTLATLGTALADQFVFTYHRFGTITIEATPGQQSVVIEESGKEGPVTTIFKSRLSLAGPGLYKTPKGTCFKVKHLSKPVINDANRHINSGDWKLTVSGTGKEWAKLKPKMPVVAIGNTPPLVYLGEKSE